MITVDWDIDRGLFVDKMINVDLDINKGLFVDRMTNIDLDIDKGLFVDRMIIFISIKIEVCLQIGLIDLDCL